MPRKKTTKKTKKVEEPKPRRVNWVQVKNILQEVYNAGWKHNKYNPIKDPFQQSVDQALENIKNEVEQ